MARSNRAAPTTPQPSTSWRASISTPATWIVSDTLNHRALEIHQQLYGDRHPLVSDDLVNIGAVQYQRGHYIEAEQYYRQALDITRALVR